MHDLALIVLSTEVDIIEGIIETIPLMDSHYEEGSTVTVIGWGVDSTDEADMDEYGYLDSAETLQELEYVIGNQAECKQYWEELEEEFHAMVQNVEYIDMDMLTGLFFIFLYYLCSLLSPSAVYLFFQVHKNNWNIS